MSLGFGKNINMRMITDENVTYKNDAMVHRSVSGLHRENLVDILYFIRK